MPLMKHYCTHKFRKIFIIIQAKADFDESSAQVDYWPEGVLTNAVNCIEYLPAYLMGPCVQHRHILMCG